MKLRDYQESAIESALDSYDRGVRSGIICQMTGGGKCHGIDTPILMHDGSIKKVQDVEVGDLLMGPDSKPRTVLSLAGGREEMYRVVPTKGDSWTCNKSHILSLVCNNKGSVVNGVFYPKSTYNKIVDISVEEYLKTSNLFKHTHKLFRVGVEFEEDDNLPIPPWILGIWLGDGSAGAPSITNPDPTIISELYKFSDEFGWSMKMISGKKRCPTWYIKGGLLSVLRQMGVLNNKHIPRNYIINNRENRLELLAGLLDSDGYVHNNTYEIISKSEDLADQIVFLARSLGLFANKTPKKGTIKSLRFVGHYHRVTISGHTDMIPCRVVYKKAGPRLQIKDALRTGFKLEPLGIGDYYGFVLDGDHRYLLGDFTVTHNTLTATNLSKRFHERHGGKTLFLIDRIELAEQTRRAFLATDPDLRIGIEMNVEEADKYDDITICSIQTIGRKGSKRIAKFASPEYSLVIADEAHMSIAPIWLRALHFLGVHPENFVDGKMLVGLTATPYRTDGKSLGYLYDDIFAQYDIRYGIKNGWLTDIEWIRIKTNTDISKVKVSGGEFAQTELTRTVDNPLRNSQIVKAYLDESPGESAIVFCAGVQHAYTVAELFKQAGVEAECIEGGTDKEVRRDWIGDFRSGKLKVLVNFGVLTTGFDAPETSTIILARPIRSTLTYTQIVGRGLRPSSSAFVDMFDDHEIRRETILHSNKPACKLIDFEDNVGNHNVCRPPMLFGLNPNAKSKKKKTTLFKDVVEVLDDVKKKTATDVTKLLDLDDIHIIVERKRVKFTSYNVDDVIKDMSQFMWLPIGDGSYEVILEKEGKALSVEKDMLDRYALFETDTKTGVSVKKQSFSSLQGAIKIADEYIRREKFDTTFLKNNAPWINRGVTFKQASLLKRLFKGGCRFGPGRYPDTGQLHVHINNNFVSSCGEANNILKERFTK